jgi:hypothetical protein
MWVCSDEKLGRNRVLLEDGLELDRHAVTRKTASG